MITINTSKSLLSVNVKQENKQSMRQFDQAPSVCVISF